jgi:chitin disaccharide deacetylase
MATIATMGEQYRAKIIVNADDYGYTSGISAGIRRAFSEGVLSSATAMMNMPTVGEAVELALEQTPDLPLGVHLVMTAGRPLSPINDVSSLVDDTGRFHSLSTVSREPARLVPDQVHVEWRRQIERLLGFGYDVDHLDSHHHSSYLHPSLLEVMLELAREFHVPVRRAPLQWSSPDAFDAFARASSGIRVPDLFVGDLMDGSSSEKLVGLLDDIPDGAVAEFMVHPGIVDDELITTSTYSHPRGPELDTLLDPSLPDRLSARRIGLARFADAPVVP